MPGIVSGSFRSQEWLPFLHDHQLATRATGGVLGRGDRHREVAVAVDGEHRDPLLAEPVEHRPWSSGCAGSTPRDRAAATAAAGGRGWSARRGGRA